MVLVSLGSLLEELNVNQREIFKTRLELDLRSAGTPFEMDPI